MKPLSLRRFRRAAAITTGLALALTLTGAPAAADKPVVVDRSARAGVEVAPLAGDLKIVRTTADGQVTHETKRVFRDRQGRTRIEAGSTATISDPAKGTTTVLDTSARTYKRSSAPDSPGLAPQAARTATISHQQLSSVTRSLGKSSFNGVAAFGREYKVTVPASGERPSQDHKVKVWSAADIQLPVHTEVVMSSGEVHQQTYTNLRVGSEPSAALFEIPAGYVDADRVAGPAAAQVDCQILPSLVFMSSFGGVLASSIVLADVIGPGCMFIADGAFFDLELSGFPLTPLGLPYDDWYVYDNGAPVPWLPWTSFGFIDYAAAAPGGPVSFGSSMIILDIF